MTADPQPARPNLPTDLPNDPLALFGRWYAEAAERELNDPHAMTVATADRDGTPSLRVLLLKEWSADGFVFYTNQRSAKGRALADNPQAELNFHWKSLQRQVRIHGTVTTVSDAEADAYFASRPRESQIGAWASQQSQPLASRQALLEAVAEVGRRHEGQPVPRPPHWSGYCVLPQTMEFWVADPFRVHERWRYERVAGGWRVGWLNP